VEDGAVTSDATFIYRVRGADATNESISGYSNNDLATTTTMNALTTIRFSDIDQLRALINRVRAATGLGGLAWTDVMAGYSSPPPQAGGFVYASHILALRTRMDAALLAAGVATPAYGAHVTPGAIMTAPAWAELQGRAQ
jgi:hypothetical protein